MPKRIQMRRSKGWRLPPGCIYVGRPTRWGNPVRVGDGCLVLQVEGYGVPGFYGRGESVGYRSGPVLYEVTLDERPGPGAAVAVYRAELEAMLKAQGEEGDWPDLVEALEELRGHDVACWCPLDQPCHADVLLDLANRDVASAA